MSDHEVRAASEQFYAALNQMLVGNADPLADIWSHSDTVTTMHPIGGRDEGWEAVGGSWGQVANISTDGSVRLADQLIRVAGDLAYEVGTERGEVKLAGHHVSIEHRVTNVYRREGGSWKIVHHHTDLAPAMLDVLQKLQADA